MRLAREPVIYNDHFGTYSVLIESKVECVSKCERRVFRAEWGVLLKSLKKQPY